MSQRRTTRSLPPVRSSPPPGRKPSDHTGRPGPTSVNAVVAEARSTIATAPPMVAAAMRPPSGESASAMIGVGPISTSARGLPSAVRMRSPPSAPPATISPSGATATALSGAAGRRPSDRPRRTGRCAAWRRSQRSRAAVRKEGDGVDVALMAVEHPRRPSPESGRTRAVPSQEAEAMALPSGETASATIGALWGSMTRTGAVSPAATGRCGRPRRRSRSGRRAAQRRRSPRPHGSADGERHALIDGPQDRRLVEAAREREPPVRRDRQRPHGTAMTAHLGQRRRASARRTS